MRTACPLAGIGDREAWLPDSGRGPASNGAVPRALLYQSCREAVELPAVIVGHLTRVPGDWVQTLLHTPPGAMLCRADLVRPVLCKATGKKRELRPSGHVGRLTCSCASVLAPHTHRSGLYKL